MKMEQKKYSKWIWMKDEPEDADKTPFLVLFRKKVVCKAGLQQVNLTVSADSRYKLYVNDNLVEVGPSKGDHQIWFQDELDITSYMKKGKNVIAVAVLRFPQNPFLGNQSVMTTSFPGLYCDGKAIDESGRIYDLSADASWKCRWDDRVRIMAETEGFSPLHFYEEVHENTQISDWKTEQFNAEGWSAAVPYTQREIRKVVSPGNLNPRTIPFMYRKSRKFQQVVQVLQSESGIDEWNAFLKEKRQIAIGSGKKEIVEIDAGEEMTGYLKLRVSGGRGARIEILQSEAYVQDRDLNEKRLQPMVGIKKNREDFEHGHLEGYKDIYHPSGTGTSRTIQSFEPFWFRTFRYIQLHIVCGEEPLILHGFDYEETGYPLEIKTHVKTSDRSLEDIWRLSERTLRRCMHETYEDCPFYEQLQYVMDSRSQILYTYAVSADDRLARKCMDDFRRSQRYDGLLCSAYPNTKPNVIPGFSIYYIMMLHDHMMYFGDNKLIRNYLPAVENILRYFEEQKTEYGYIGKTGDVYGQGKFWSFIDWAPQWESGVPNAVCTGNLTMESLLYLMGLKAAAELCSFIGRMEQADDYRKQADELKVSIRTHCIGENGMLKDGANCEEYSQHCQVFGILTGVFDKNEGRKNLLETIENKAKYPQCTVSMALYLFRALEQTGLYSYTDEYWEIWRKMIRNHMTTSAESDTDPRSECHGWGALALYEIPSVILGVRPGAPGYGKVRISPVPGYLSWAEGEAATPKGKVFVSWKKEGDKVELEYRVPDGLTVEGQEEM